MMPLPLAAVLVVAAAAAAEAAAHTSAPSCCTIPTEFLNQLPESAS
jgi:hypothetical protein